MSLGLQHRQRVSGWGQGVEVGHPDGPALGRLCWRASGRLVHRVGACAGPSSGTSSWGLPSFASPCENGGSSSSSRRQCERRAAPRQVGRAWCRRLGVRAGRGMESWGWSSVWHWLFWGWISYTWLVTREGKWFREGARLTQGHARSSVLEQGLGFGLAAFQPLPGLYRALCGAPLPYPPPSASDYLGWPNPAGPGLTHGAPGEEWQPGQCPRGTAHSGGWRGPQ